LLVRGGIAFLIAVLLLAGTARPQTTNVTDQQAPPIRITSGPTIEHYGAEDAIIAWSTNVSSGTEVLFGIDPQHLDHRAETPWGALTHRVTLKHLSPDTTYYFRAISDQALGTGDKAESGVLQFRTEGKVQAAN